MEKKQAPNPDKEANQFLGLMAALALCVFALYQCSWKPAAEAKKAEAAEAAAAQAKIAAAARAAQRPVFPMSVNELIVKYNERAALGDRSMMLPPASSMAVLGEAKTFLALMHQVNDSSYAVIRVDRTTGKPFSLSFTVTGASGSKGLTGMLIPMLAVGGSLDPEHGAHRMFTLCTESAVARKAQEAMTPAFKADCVLESGVLSGSITAI